MENNLAHIIEGCQQNRRTSQKDLYKLFLPYVKSLARRYLFEKSYINDVVHDVFIKIFVRIQKNYDAAKGPLKPWIARLAINTIYDFNKKANAKKTDEITEDVVLTQTTEDALFRLEKEDLFKFVDKMPLTLRTVFNMHVIDGLAHTEISKILDIDSAVSRKRLSRAREWLKGCIYKSEKTNSKA